MKVGWEYSFDIQNGKNKNLICIIDTSLFGKNLLFPVQPAKTLGCLQEIQFKSFSLLSLWDALPKAWCN